ncbi:hypothetical protein BN440_1089 [Erwinia amylovora MR1]|nr:hypothetical protein BN440_1089 [Erwinia amylovora MR1]
MVPSRWRGRLCCLVDSVGNPVNDVRLRHSFLVFLYTWPFFLALLPVSVLAGIVISALLRGHVIWTALVTPLLTLSLFWLLFCLLSSW